MPLTSGCVLQAHRKSDNAVLLLTFDALDIVARSNTAKNPIPTDSIILDGALGGFDVSESNAVSYGSGANLLLNRNLLQVSTESPDQRLPVKLYAFYDICPTIGFH